MLLKNWFIQTSNCSKSAPNYAFSVQYGCGLSTTPTTTSMCRYDCAYSSSVGKDRQVIKQLCCRMLQYMYYTTVATECVGYVLYRVLVTCMHSKFLYRIFFFPIYRMLVWKLITDKTIQIQVISQYHPTSSQPVSFVFSCLVKIYIWAHFWHRRNSAIVGTRKVHLMPFMHLKVLALVSWRQRRKTEEQLRCTNCVNPLCLKHLNRSVQVYVFEKAGNDQGNLDAIAVKLSQFGATLTQYQDSSAERYSKTVKDECMV